MSKYELVTETVLNVDNLTFIVDHEHEDIWMDQKTIAVLLDTTVKTVSYHLNKKFESGELVKEEVQINPKSSKNIGRFPKTDSLTKQPIYYNLDAIIAVAYSVNSIQAAKVRKWANGILKRYLIDGVVVDEQRVLEDEHTQKKLDQIVGEVRSHGNDLMKSAQRIFSNAKDYDPNSQETHNIMAEFTNIILKSVSNKTSGELMWYRSDSNAPNAGMTTYKGKKGPTLADASIGTNFLTNDEHKKRFITLDSIYSTILNFELDHDDFYMQDVIDVVKQYLQILERPILEDHGTVSHKKGKEKSQNELKKWRKDPNRILK